MYTHARTEQSEQRCSNSLVQCDLNVRFIPAMRGVSHGADQRMSRAIGAFVFENKTPPPSRTPPKIRPLFSREEETAPTVVRLMKLRREKYNDYTTPALARPIIQLYVICDCAVGWRPSWALRAWRSGRSRAGTAGGCLGRRRK